MIHWNSGLNLGVAKLDSDHKRLLEYINKLSQSIRQNDTQERKNRLYNNFLELAIEHSKSEEKMLKECNCSSSDEHIRCHEVFKDELYRLKDEFLTAKSTAEIHKICFTLTDLLLNHIVEEDIPLIRELQICGLIESPKHSDSIISKLIYKTTNTFTFTKRILLSALIPLIGMLLFISIIITEKYNHYQDLIKTSSITYILYNIDELVHSMQIERGLSCGYLSSNTSAFNRQLQRQKEVVQREIHKFNSKLTEIDLKKIFPISQNITKFQKDVIALKSFRLNVSDKSVTLEETIDFYTKIINNIINITAKMSLFNLDRDISLSISSLSILLHYKETLGLKRARGTTIIEMKAASKHDYNRFIELTGVQKKLLKDFRESATSKNREALNQTINMEVSKKISSYENSIIDKKFSKLSSVVWFKDMTTLINKIKALEESLLKEISMDIEKNLYQEENSLTAMIVITIFIFIAVLFIIYIFEQSSKREIIKYTNAMNHLAEGDRSLQLVTEMAKGEMAQMYNAYEITRQKLLKGDIYTQLYLNEKESELKSKEQEAIKLEEMAYYDPLTGAINRRKFDELSQTELKRAKRYNKKVSFLMLDIDHFKSINDTYGHSVGDEVLKAFASTCLNMARELDVVARIGGEEFVVMLPETDADGAFIFAERFRKAIENTPVNIEDKSIKYTVSIGISTFDNLQSKQSVKSLLQDADKALYRAKESGRNKSVIFKD